MDANMILNIFMASFCLYLMIHNFVERRQHQNAQKDLLNRLMSINFSDYTMGTIALSNKDKIENIPTDDQIGGQDAVDVY